MSILSKGNAHLCFLDMHDHPVALIPGFGNRARHRMLIMGSQILCNTKT
jgi:hypothetical protein